ncbi:NAD(+) synthase [Vulcanibacillus modesticaldus]|uniref:NH(3)-dependent NAD(+) synthetase n=1 Tax=Vulcanibacillus modesticaldus TaxID=337097 RepID=A0A1D2YX73_9BACI|nr:NAD(+) synthase [Vulcanibacillus modesticaldus]OEG00223.1 NAD(+) synthase [Vulcanibacillus modesticaldus]
MDKFEEILHSYQENIEEDVKKRVEFIRNYVKDANAKGVVVGISGGIDSAVTAALAIIAMGKENVIGVWMPAYSDPIHERDAKALASAIDLNLVTVDLGSTFNNLAKEIEEIVSLNDLAKGNTKARLRMTTLYAIASVKGYLVSDTCNYSEIYVGYMTKGGDGLADFNPVGSLTKHQIRLLAKHLNIPKEIIEKAPSADLWAGQTDEQEMGFTYEDLDRYLLTGEGNKEVIEKIERLHRISEHKRVLMPTI